MRAKIEASVIDTFTGDTIYENRTIAEISAAMGIKYKTLSNAKTKGNLVQKRYLIKATGFYKAPEQPENKDDYALEWEVKEFCKKLRQQVGIEILCGIGLHGITEEGQIVR